MTHQFTDEQIEAACVAYEYTNAFGPERETRMRAALEAAQDAAPQAESDPYRIVRVLHEHQRDTSVTSRVKCVCGVTCGDRASHRLHQAELIAHLAPAPVQPSSTVDEAALAEVIADHGYDSSRLDYCTCGEKVKAGMSEHAALAIAEYLTGGAK